jgi:hypothetical protein
LQRKANTTVYFSIIACQAVKERWDESAWGKSSTLIECCCDDCCVFAAQAVINPYNMGDSGVFMGDLGTKLGNLSFNEAVRQQAGPSTETLSQVQWPKMAS